jgi:hypothetical protein
LKKKDKISNLICIIILFFNFIAKGQEIKLDSLTYNLGKIKIGTTYKLKIPLTNSGDKALLIEQIQSTPSDAVANCTKEPIKPNEKVIINAQFYINRIGKFTKFFTIISNSNSDQLKRLLFYIKFEIVE